MYVSIVRLDESQQERIMFSIQVSESEGLYKFADINGASFTLGEDQYCLSGEFIKKSMKGYILLKKNDVSIARAITTLDPTFLLTLTVDSSYSLEVNISLGN